MQKAHPRKPLSDISYGLVNVHKPSFGTTKKNAALMARLSPATPKVHDLISPTTNFRPRLGKTTHLCKRCGRINEKFQEMQSYPCADQMVAKTLTPERTVPCSTKWATRLAEGTLRKWQTIADTAKGNDRVKGGKIPASEKSEAQKFCKNYMAMSIGVSCSIARKCLLTAREVVNRELENRSSKYERKFLKQSMDNIARSLELIKGHGTEEPKASVKRNDKRPASVASLAATGGRTEKSPL